MQNCQPTSNVCLVHLFVSITVFHVEVLQGVFSPFLPSPGKVAKRQQKKLGLSMGRMKNFLQILSNIVIGIKSTNYEFFCISI